MKGWTLAVTCFVLAVAAAAACGPRPPADDPTDPGDGEPTVLVEAGDPDPDPGWEETTVETVEEEDEEMAPPGP